MKYTGKLVMDEDLGEEIKYTPPHKKCAAYCCSISVSALIIGASMVVSFFCAVLEFRWAYTVPTDEQFAEAGSCNIMYGGFVPFPLVLAPDIIFALTVGAAYTVDAPTL